MSKLSTLTFENIVQAADTAKADTGVGVEFDSREEMSELVSKFSEQCSGECDISRAKAILLGDIKTSRFSPRYKKQLAGTVSSFTDLDELHMWLRTSVA